MIKAVRGRVGPVGLSLAAAALTAVAFAAVSVAKDDSGAGGPDNGDVVGPGPGPPGGPPEIEDLSDEDRQALEEFRQCMSEEGVEPPPRPEAGEDGKFERRLGPPGEEQRAEIEKALEACRDKLPEGAPAMGPHPCGPPPGVDGEGEGAREGTAIPAPPLGSGSRQEGSSTGPAPQGATS